MLTHPSPTFAAIHPSSTWAWRKIIFVPICSVLIWPRSVCQDGRGLPTQHPSHYVTRGKRITYATVVVRTKSNATAFCAFTNSAAIMILSPHSAGCEGWRHGHSLFLFSLPRYRATFSECRMRRVLPHVLSLHLDPSFYIFASYLAILPFSVGLYHCPAAPIILCFNDPHVPPQTLSPEGTPALLKALSAFLDRRIFACLQRPWYGRRSLSHFQFETISRSPSSCSHSPQLAG